MRKTGTGQQLHDIYDDNDDGDDMFATDLLSIIRSLNSLYTAIGIYHASYVDSLLARSGLLARSS
jgi:hypothetical protein